MNSLMTIVQSGNLALVLKQHVRKKEGSLARRLKSAYNLHFRPGSSSLLLDKDSRTHANPI